MKALRLPAVLLCFFSSLTAAPKLRLVTTTVGPITVATGGNGPAQTVEAYNAGDGALSLSLSVASSVTWLGASVGTPRACSTRAGNCIPLQFALNTAALSAGSQTAIVTVNDPNAIDAPQTITVTVQIGSGIPNSVDVYVAPGSTRDTRFATNGSLNSQATTQDGTRWLSLVLDGTGSFRFPVPYRIHVAPPAGMAEGTFTGSVTITGSSFAGDNKTVPVTMRVTTQPIIQASTDRLRVRVAQGAPPLASLVSVTNLGQGTLAVQSVSTSGGAWLTAANSVIGVLVTVDPGTMAVGTYSGSVSIVSNAVNGTIAVPVDFEVIAKSGPVIRYQGAVNNGTFAPGEPVARGDVVALMGEQFAFSSNAGHAPPLDTQIGTTTVLVNGNAAPMYYSLYQQIAFQMPVDAPLGTALMQVQRDGINSNTISVDVVDRAPRIGMLNIGNFGTIVNARDNSLPLPSSYQIPGFATHPAQSGDVLTIYAIGLGPTNPVVATGAPAPFPAATLTVTPVINVGGSIGGTAVTPFFAGLSPTYAGLYQLNLTIPDNVPKGIVELSIAWSDVASNSVEIAIQ